MISFLGRPSNVSTLPVGWSPKAHIIQAAEPPYFPSHLAPLESPLCLARGSSFHPRGTPHLSAKHLRLLIPSVIPLPPASWLTMLLPPPPPLPLPQFGAWNVFIDFSSHQSSSAPQTPLQSGISFYNSLVSFFFELLNCKSSLRLRLYLSF